MTGCAVQSCTDWLVHQRARYSRVCCSPLRKNACIYNGKQMFCAPEVCNKALAEEPVAAGLM